MTKQNQATPGPWKAQQDCRSYRNAGIFDGTNPDKDGNQNAWAIYGQTRIALLSEAEAWLPQSEVNANARLFAAAPEMLAALEKIHFVLNNSTGRAVTTWSEIDSIARDAIVSAKEAV